MSFCDEESEGVLVMSFDDEQMIDSEIDDIENDVPEIGDGDDGDSIDLEGPGDDDGDDDDDFDDFDDEAGECVTEKDQYFTPNGEWFELLLLASKDAPPVVIMHRVPLFRVVDWGGETALFETQLRSMTSLPCHIMDRVKPKSNSPYPLFTTMVCGDDETPEGSMRWKDHYKHGQPIAPGFHRLRCTKTAAFVDMTVRPEWAE